MSDDKSSISSRSNILSVFSPPAPRTLGPEEQCLPCTVIQSGVSLAGGLYLTSNLPFKDFKTGHMAKLGSATNPWWWVRTVKGCGVLLVGLSAYRGGEVIQSVLHKYGYA